jgi:hypothetical protein
MQIRAEVGTSMIELVFQCPPFLQKKKKNHLSVAAAIPSAVTMHITVFP